MANLRAGLIGLGMMGRHHARVLRQLAGVDLVAVADPGGDPHGVAGELPVLPDVQGLIETGIDYAVAAAPPRGCMRWWKNPSPVMWPGPRGWPMGSPQPA